MIRTMAPRVGRTCIVAHRGDGEGVTPVGIILGTSIHFEASHISRQAGSTRVTIACTRTTIASAGVVEQNLKILISIIILLGIETQRHAQLGSQKA